MKALGAQVRRVLLSYLETRDVYELANEDEMSPELQEKLFKGQILLNSLIQYKYSPLTKDEIISRFTQNLEVKKTPNNVEESDDLSVVSEEGS